MPKVKITWIVEFMDQPAESIYPVTGRSGNTYGYAQFCPKRGTYCLRMTEQQFTEARQDIFGIGRRFYYPVPAVEVEVVEEVVAPKEVIVEQKAEPTQEVVAPVVAPIASVEKKGFKKVGV